MNISICIRKMWLVAIAILLFPLTSCNGVIYDEEGDCTVYYRLKFRYDKNLKWADAFANEVTSVHLYAFDKSDVLVWQKEEQVDSSTAENYSMLLDLPAGDYRLLAWCGLKNDGEYKESFSVPEVSIGKTRIEQLKCALNRKRDEFGAYSKERLYRLFHGTLDVSLSANGNGGSYEDTMYLTKNTNHIRIILQHLSGEDINVDRFTFRINDENGLMAYNNDILTDENINYRPWKTLNGEVGVGKNDTRAIITVKGAIVDLTVGRMMYEHRSKMILTITNDVGETVVRIPVIDYALLAKNYYEEEYGHLMTNQEFLDREDEYVMTLFLDENNNWLSSYILIHSWRVVLDNIELQ